MEGFPVTLNLLYVPCVKSKQLQVINIRQYWNEIDVYALYVSYTQHMALDTHRGRNKQAYLYTSFCLDESIVDGK